MSITICDVGPRDGLQNQPVTLEPAVRAELVDMLAAAGVPRIEAVSFVSPKHVPQMAGAEEVVAALERREGVVYAGLAVNERGYDRLCASGLDEVHFAFAATEEFNQRNAHASVEDGVAGALRIVERAKADGIRSTVTIGVAFGCPFEGDVPPAQVASIAQQMAAMGIHHVALGDTTGMATPPIVRAAATKAGTCCWTSGERMIPAYGSAAPISRAPSTRRIPFSSPSRQRSSNAGGRIEPACNITITSVPPASGRQPGVSRYSRTASARSEGRR